MTTLVIDDKEAEAIIAQYGEKTIIEYIKTFTPTLHKYVDEDDLDSRLRALKVLNTDTGKRLDEALEFLKENCNK